MQKHASSVQPGRSVTRPLPDGAIRIALDENELAIRWGAFRQDPAPLAAGTARPGLLQAWCPRHLPDSRDRSIRASRFAALDLRSCVPVRRAAMKELTLYPADLASMTVAQLAAAPIRDFL